MLPILLYHCCRFCCSIVTEFVAFILTEIAALLFTIYNSLKQLLARSRYLLFKHPGAWTREQRQRAELLFTRYPVIHKGYQLSLCLGEVFRHCTSKEQAFKKLALWYNDVEDAGLPSFKTLACSGYLKFMLDRTNPPSFQLDPKLL
ncbi:transposase [Chitinophaga tropicalis]|uniref:Transposase IS204/IS1001/IS1096/IS1165 DDE domain-containing protein n=1 Tax=Chitinophaga tropicalis TaxID=2683588 RepID=A0A7K1UE96_9BACT|nr:transposase [Chitinophaga tropicalis]MVT12663.1 hypothetical protein [Chitinophaga tropicalis]